MKTQKNHDGISVNPVAVVAFLVCIIVPIAAFIWFQYRSEPSPESFNPGETVTATSSPNSTQSESATTTSDPSTPPSPDGCTQAEELDTRVRCFVEAWYLLTPDDSTESKRARVEPYASELFMEQSAGSMEVFTDTGADQARINAEVTMSGEAAGEILSEPEITDPNLIRVVTTVTLSEQSPSMTATPYLTLHSEMVWSNLDGTWRVESVHDKAIGGV